jgi:replicative DNA helicase
MNDAVSALLDNPLPRNIGAEQSILGTILIDSSTIHLVQDSLDSSDFDRDSHKVIYRAMLSLVEQGKEIDLLTVKDELSRLGALDGIGGSAYVSSLVDNIPDINNLPSYVEIVKEKARQRRMMVRLFSAIQEVAKQGSANVAAQLIDALTPVAKEQDGISLVYAGDLMREALAEIEERYTTQNYFTGIRTGFSTLDDYLSGWQPGVLHLVGAYTSAGKTTLGLEIAQKILKHPDNAGKYVFYFALEMTRKMLSFRILANQARQNLYFVRTGSLSEPAFDSVVEAGLQFTKFGQRFGVSDNAFTLQQIVSVSRALKRAGKLDVVLVDYLQLIEGKRDEESRQREVDLAGKALLRLAKELNVAVIAFAQLNEGAVNRPDHEVLLSDMRESRAINQHARTVLLLNRPWMFERGPDSPYKECDAYLKIEKNSEGRTGRIPLHFEGKYQSFSESPCAPGCDFFLVDPQANTALDKEIKEYDRIRF